MLRTAAMAVLLVMTAAAAHAQDLNDPGSWAYEGCKQGLLAQVKQSHPQVTAVEIDGHVERDREDDRIEKLTGKAKFDKGDDIKFITFECLVDRDAKKVDKVKYEN